MLRKLLIISIALSLFLNSVTSSLAVVDPRQYPNNIFGIHIMNESDLEDAARLVNSNGGEWGYVTIVIQENDRDVDKWQQIFDKMRELKLIPLVRIATKPAGEVWVKPSRDELPGWVDFLFQLNWVVKNRYVILFNEPNHSQEWGSELNPEDYTQIAHLYRNALKERSLDFFVLPAGFDAAAGNVPGTMDVQLYWQRMANKDPEIFKIFDGWNSHSYPNPGFSASPVSFGKGSVASFSWEVNYLTKYGLSPSLPIFITETGWVHNENSSRNSRLSSVTIGDFYKTAFEYVWRDPRIVAVTPFILNYTSSPFAQFSWKVQNGEFLPQYSIVQSLAKNKGEPEQDFSNKLIEFLFPRKLVTDSIYKIQAKFANTGQAIWEEKNIQPRLMLGDEILKLDSYSVQKTPPGETSRIDVVFSTPLQPQNKDISLQLSHKDKTFGERPTTNVEIIPPPLLHISVSTWLGSINGQDLKFLIYDGNEVLAEYANFEIANNQAQIKELKGVVPGKIYRFVLIKPGFLPKQAYKTIEDKENSISFHFIAPVDLNHDGRLSFEDLKGIF